MWKYVVFGMLGAALFDALVFLAGKAILWFSDCKLMEDLRKLK